MACSKLVDDIYAEDACRKLSLKDLDSDSKRFPKCFPLKAIRIFTVHNSGIADDDSNCCYFISLQQALSKYFNVVISIPELKKLARFIWRHTMVDTDKPEHLKCLSRLAKHFPEIKFYIYLGAHVNGEWYVAPDCAHTIGNGARAVRILNMGKVHFELITNSDSEFVDGLLTDSIIRNARAHQERAFSNVEQNKGDYSTALNLQRELDEQAAQAEQASIELIKQLQREAEQERIRAEQAELESKALIEQLLREAEQEKAMAKIRAEKAELKSKALIEQLLQREAAQKKAQAEQEELANRALIEQLLREDAEHDRRIAEILLRHPIQHFSQQNSHAV